MTSQLEVRQAVIGRIDGVVRDMKYIWHVPEVPEPRSVWVLPDFPFADFELTYGPSAEWRFMLTFVADRIDSKAAQAQLSTWMDPKGPFTTALRSRRIVDDLSRMTHYVRVAGGSNFGEGKWENLKLFYAQKRVIVRV